MSSALQSSKLSVFGKPLMDGETRHAVASSVSDENIGHQLVTVSAVMIALQVLAVGARLSARRVQKTVFFVDDYLIVVALLGGLAICGIAIMGVNVAKFGRHQDWIMTNEPDSLTPFGKLSVAAQSLQTPIAITFAKLSILFFYRRIFPLPSIHCAILAIGAWIVAHGFATLLVSLLQCIPLSAVWDAGVKGKCIDPVSWLRWMSLPNIMSDLALIILPLYVIWRLQKSRTERLGLSVIFLSGSFNIICSAIRMAVLFRPSVSQDITFYSVSIHSWTILEATTLIVAACLPFIWPLVKSGCRRLKPKKQELSEKAPATRLGLPDRSIVVAAWAERQFEDDLETLSLPPSANVSPANSPAVAAREAF